MHGAVSDGHAGGRASRIPSAVVGGLIGWLANRLQLADVRQGLVVSVLIGVVGALIGGWVLAPLLTLTAVNDDNFSIVVVVTAVVGAIVLLGVVDIARRLATR